MSPDKLELLKPLTSSSTVPQGVIIQDSTLWNIENGGEGIRSTFPTLSKFTSTLTSLTSSPGTTVSIKQLTKSSEPPAPQISYSQLKSTLSQYTSASSDYKYPTGCNSFQTLKSTSTLSPEEGLKFLHTLSDSKSEVDFIETSDKLFSLLTLPKSTEPVYKPFLITLYNLTVHLTLKTLGRPYTTLNRLRYFDALGVIIGIEGGGEKLSRPHKATCSRQRTSIVLALNSAALWRRLSVDTRSSYHRYVNF